MAAPALPLVMGVVNVTPDSFSDGGRYDDPARAIAHARTLQGMHSQATRDVRSA